MIWRFFAVFDDKSGNIWQKSRTSGMRFSVLVRAIATIVEVFEFDVAAKQNLCRCEQRAF